MKFRVCCLFLLLGASLAQAGGEERRIFAISVDRRPAGANQITIQNRDDGSQVVTCQADVAVKILLISYRYNFKDTETWKDGRLVQMSSATNDDGKRHSVNLEANAEGYAMKVNGRDYQVKGEPWLTTYWKLPPEKQRGANIVLLDADTGKLINAKFEKIGLEKISLMGKPTDCLHYKLSGGVQVDLWYDGDDRLVRQELIEQGHRTVLELSRLDRE